MRDEGTYTPADSEVQAQVRALAIVACDLCDESGYRGARVCNHVDYAEPAQRWMPVIREALSKGKA